MISIYKLKKSEYKEGAKLAFENFEDLLNVSEKAAQIGKLGTATSLCILSIEELAKSVILELLAINNSIPIKNLEKYFTSHEQKHLAAISLFFNLKSTFETNQTKQDNEMDSDFILVIIILIVLLALSIDNKAKLKNKRKEKSFLDTFKESGFYVEFNTDSRQWISPKMEHNQERFESLFQLTSEFATSIKNWIINGKLSKENLLKFLHSLDDDLIDKSRLEKLL
ncbi:MAG: AbiV family abortive infection protein [Bacteroidetes bacterium]|nr:AbiV family abortive infection protein [Bacteroidota bacterium]